MLFFRNTYERHFTKFLNILKGINYKFRHYKWNSKIEPLIINSLRFGIRRKKAFLGKKKHFGDKDGPGLAS